MTVKCISQATKDRIITAYRVGAQQKDLAKWYITSERTINRVLIEAGLLTPVPQLKADAYIAMQVLKKHGIEAGALDEVLSIVRPTYEQVVDFLEEMRHDVVVQMFYDAMMNKALDAQLAQQAVTYQMEANADADLPF